MKVKRILFLALGMALLCGCYTSRQISMFSANQVELGMSKQDFIARHGNPFNQEASYGKDNKLEEKLLYKEELYSGVWYVVTTAFIFQDSKLIKQEVKEERKYQDCDCKGTSK